MFDGSWTSILRQFESNTDDVNPRFFSCKSAVVKRAYRLEPVSSFVILHPSGPHGAGAMRRVPLQHQ